MLPKKKLHAVDADLVFQPTISIPPVMQMIKKNHGNLMCQLALLRASEGSFPEEDFKPLSTITALESSNDTIRMNLARVLVTKVLSEGKRLALISKIAEPNGKLLRSVVSGLIQSQGVLTPSLDKYLKVSLSSSHIESWKKFKRANKKKVGRARRT